MSEIPSNQQFRLTRRRGAAAYWRVQHSGRVLAGLAILLLLIPASRAGAETQPSPSVAMTLSIDARDVDHRVLHVAERLRVQPGPNRLYYPKWIPGDHAPTGPIEKVAGLRMSANGERVAWRRDPLEMFAFDVDVPPGVLDLDVAFDVVPATGDDHRATVAMSVDLLALQWNTVVFYPAGHDLHRIEVTPSVTLPEGWHAATSLGAGVGDAEGLRFPRVALDTLLDSPVLAARHLRTLDVSPDQRTPVRLNVAGDESRLLELTPAQIELHRQMVRQSLQLFGPAPFEQYDFLVWLSDGFGESFGLEHHRSSENRLEASFFSEWDKGLPGRFLLPHELVHAWNGKSRRPSDLWASDFNTPTQNGMLWVYEGQTEYWGFVLTARSGLWQASEARDALALIAARYQDARPGFAWRNLQDTTNEPIISQGAPQSYRSWQLRTEYYQGGQLLWLAVDAKLRELSGDARSLDDFAREFFAPAGAPGSVSTYTFDDVVAALAELAPFDWAAFLRERLVAPAPPLDGLSAVGWRVTYTDTPTEYYKSVEGREKWTDLTFSLGLVVKEQGASISAVLWDGPAFRAGVPSGSTLVAVDGRAYSADRLREAIKLAQSGTRPIELLVKQGDLYRTVAVDYHAGLRYPHLEPLPGKVDRLSAILAPR